MINRVHCRAGLSRFGLVALGPVALLAACATQPEPMVRSFPELARSSVPPNYLACPPHYCPGAIDLETSPLPLGADELSRVVRQTIDAKPRTVFIRAEEKGRKLQYQQHSELLDFTDTITIGILAASPGESTISIFSQSGMGLYDFGVNEARVRDWLASIEEAARTR
jgi:uncharacterized protein (DUF1499 family)